MPGCVRLPCRNLEAALRKAAKENAEYRQAYDAHLRQLYAEPRHGPPSTARVALAAYCSRHPRGLSGADAAGIIADNLAASLLGAVTGELEAIGDKTLRLSVLCVRLPARCHVRAHRCGLRCDSQTSVRCALQRTRWLRLWSNMSSPTAETIVEDSWRRRVVR